MLLEMQLQFLGSNCRRSRSKKNIEFHSFHVHQLAMKISFAKQSCSHQIYEAFQHLG